jgi:hypothetical protein
MVAMVARTKPGSRSATRAGSPSRTRPPATATSVAVSTSPPKTPGPPRQLEADAARADGAGRGIDDAAAAEADREDVGHAEIGAHAANFHGDGGLAWKTLLQRADIRGRTADIDNNGVMRRQTGRQRRACELVGPEAKLSGPGIFRRSAASISVPSFWVRKRRPA